MHPPTVRTKANYSCGTTAVENLTRIWIIPTERLQTTSWRSMASMSLLVERVSVSRRSPSADASTNYGRNVLWTDEACFTREAVTSGHGTVLMLSSNILFSVGVSAGIVGDMSLVPTCCLRLAAELCPHTLGNILTRLLEDVPIAVGQWLWLHHEGAAALCGEHIRQWLVATYPGR
jgi:hypothetical protein